MADDKNTKNGFDIGVGDALFDIDIYSFEDLFLSLSNVLINY